MSVTLHVYDLSQGMASQMSPALLGKQIGGIWHTGIVAFGREYYFGGGICVDAPGTTPYGSPVEEHVIGSTSKSSEEFLAFLRSVSSRFTMETYNLFEHNCNNFSDECSRFLTGKGIPEYILNLPSEVLSTSMGQMIRPMIDSMQNGIRDASIGHEVNLGNGLASAPVAKSAPRYPALDALHRAKIQLAKANRDAIKKKLRELDDSTDPESIQSLFSYLETSSPANAFPALDLIRLHALNPTLSKTIQARLKWMLERYVLMKGTGVGERASCMMVLRTAVNLLFVGEVSGVLLGGDSEVLVDAAVEGLQHGHAQVRMAAVSLVLNIAISVRHGTPLDESSSVRLVCALAERLAEETTSSSEVGMLLGAIAAFSEGDEDSKLLAKTLDIDAQSIAKREAGSLSAAALQLQELLNG
ncbi:hypothetical protein NDN08_007295 [Rhodosorus marinus]|uniref:PPPDE domain-containing protein n=1 Tax=Rhodosorus marinus TaxID=101924 RepID=A0AAV8UHJ3_9RHOD|nr:hypothetical protein NDN08_007295 [Rhodosorus marinus]